MQNLCSLLPPTTYSTLPGDLRSFLGRQAIRPRPAALAPKRHRRLVLTVLGRPRVLLDLPCGDLGDSYGGTDNVGWALLSLGSSGHTFLVDAFR